MEFHHIKSTSNYPQLPTAGGISHFTDNPFDQLKWQGQQKIKLLNVLWDENYENVAFDETLADLSNLWNAAGQSFEIKLPPRFVYDYELELPVLFDNAVGYNYAIIEYAASDFKAEPTHLGYFISNIAPGAVAQTTKLQISLDYWTTFIYQLLGATGTDGVTYMQLERGHAPMLKTSVEKYLADPLHNNDYLLAPDVNFGEADEVSSSAFVPFGTGEKYVLIASTISKFDIKNIGKTKPISATEPIYLSDASRNGSDAIVDGLNYAAGDVDYSGLKRPTILTTENNNIANGYSMLAVSAVDVYENGFFTAMLEQCPQFLESIAALFVVSAEMVKLSNPETLFKRTRATWAEAAASGKTYPDLNALDKNYSYIDDNSAEVFEIETTGFTVYDVEPADDAVLDSLTLSKDLFAYAPQYSNIAKLYTSPYAHLEVSGSDGETATIKIERTSSVKVKSKCAIAFPYLRYEVFLSGIGSDASNEFTWVDLHGSEHSADIPAGDFRDFVFGFDIPTFELRMPGYDSYRLHNYNTNNVVAAEQAALAYENGTRSANTSLQNALDAQDAAYANTNADISANYENTQRSASTALENALLSNDTVYRNATGNADTAKTNSLANTATTLANSLRSNETANTIALANATTGNTTTLASAKTENDNANASADLAKSNEKDNADRSYTNGVASATTSNTNAKASAATAKSNADTSADTAKTNADTSADAAQANATASANTAYINTSNSSTNSVTNTALQVATSESNTSLSTAAALKITGLSNSLAQALQAWEAGLSRELAVLAFEQAGISAAIGAVTNIGAGALTGGVAGAGGAAVDATVQAAATAIGFGFNAERTELIISNSQQQLNERTNNTNDIQTEKNKLSTNVNTNNNTLATATTKNTTDTANTNADNTKKTSISNASRSATTTKTNAALTQTTTKANAAATLATANANADLSLKTEKDNLTGSRDLAKAIADRNYTTTIDNAGRSYTTAKSNAALNLKNSTDNANLSKTTADSNANDSATTANANTVRSYDCTIENAELSRETADTNAKRTNATTLENLDNSTAKAHANAGRSNAVALANQQFSRDTSVANAQRNLEIGAGIARKSYLDRKLDTPVIVAEASGDPMPDAFHWRGLQVKVVTQKDDEIAQAGDQMLRYGYKVNRNWKFDGLNKMKHFTYWKCEDVWFARPNATPETNRLYGKALQVIRAILMNGTTVWSEYDKIGTYSIYENEPEETK